MVFPSIFVLLIERKKMEELINKYFEGTISSEEKDILFNQIENDNDTRSQFLSHKKINALSSMLPQENDTEYAQTQFDIFNQTIKKSKIKTHFTVRVISSIAVAAVILIGIIAYGIFNKRNNDIIDNASLELQATLLHSEISTSSGEIKTIVLSDSSIIWLNSNTTIRISKTYNNDNRMVELLTGEAFFEVSHNKDLPFIVSSNGYNIKVLGTKFNVFAYPNRQFKTSLIEGSIELSSSNSQHLFSPITLTPNKSIEEIDGDMVAARINIDDMLWKNGIMAFKNDTFKSVTQKLETCYDVKIDIKDSILSDYIFSGKIRIEGGIDAALSALHKALQFNYIYDKNNNRYIITI